MLQYQSSSGAILAWRQAASAPALPTGTVVPRRGWLLLVGGHGRTQTSWRRAAGAAGSTDLAIADALHGHTADALTLTAAAILTVADALHGHAADNLTLDTTGAATLTTQDATHAHAVDAPMLYTDWLLAVAEATHGHAADNVALSDAPELAPQDAIHGHTADALALSADTWLTIQQATQAQAADRLTLSGTGIAEVTSRYIVRASVVSRVVNPSAGTRIVRPR